MKLQLKRPASLLLALSLCGALAGCGSTAETTSQATEETAPEKLFPGLTRRMPTLIWRTLITALSLMRKDTSRV